MQEVSVLREYDFSQVGRSLTMSFKRKIFYRLLQIELVS